MKRNDEFFYYNFLLRCQTARKGREGRAGRKTEFEFLLDLEKNIEMPVYGDRDYVEMGLGRAVTSKSDRNSIKLSTGSIERGSDACEQLFRRYTSVEMVPKPSLPAFNYLHKAHDSICFCYLLLCFFTFSHLSLKFKLSSRSQIVCTKMLTKRNLGWCLKHRLFALRFHIACEKSYLGFETVH